MILPTLLLSAVSCGLRNNPEPALGGSSEDLEQTGGGRVAVADFHYMKLDVNFPDEYAIDSEWIYIIDVPWFVEEGSEDDGLYVYVSRNRIADGYQEQNYIKRKRSIGEEDAVYALEKYGTDGALRWRAEYTSEELMGGGRSSSAGDSGKWQGAVV